VIEINKNESFCKKFAYDCEERFQAMIKDISANRDQQVEMQVKIRDNAKSISLLDNTE
jgi:hypothetical protein